MSELVRLGGLASGLLAIACSSNGRPAHTTERVTDSPATAKSSPDAAVNATSVDAIPDAADEDDLDDALGDLSSEHGDRDVQPVEWWRKNAAKVRPELRAQLDDGNEDIISDKWAIRILGDIGDPADVVLLEKVLTTFKYEGLRWTAAQALGKIQSPEATTALITATKHPDPVTAGSAADGLGMRKNDAAARARLEELLDHSSEDVRYHAVNALAEIGGSKAALQKRKRIEKDAEVRQAIAKALRKK